MADTIWTLLNNHLYSDATRLAEVYHAEVNNEESLYLVALSYFRNRKLNSAHEIISSKIEQISKNCNQAKCHLLLTQCCYELGKYHEAEKALFNDELNLSNSSIFKEQLVNLYGESSAAIAAKYAGLIYEKTCRPESAVEFFRISLELNPYLWGSAEALIRITNRIPNESPIQSSFSPNSSFLANALSKIRLDSTQYQPVTHSIEPANIPHTLQQQPVQQLNLVKLNPATPNDLFKTPPKKPPAVIKPATRKKVQATVCPRRSSRLFSVIGNNQTPATTNSISNNAVSNAPAKKIRRAGSVILEQDVALDSIGSIYLQLYKALDFLHQYKLDQSIALLNELPFKHKSTGWVLCCLGRAYYEKTDYNESVKYYGQARQAEPYRLEGMEYFSSALWHLHKEVELSRLARELMEFDENCPETWCVAGNCYSLQKEHESAIKYLERAIKVDPHCAYAFTLLGHELICTERLDQAMTCFRNAKRLDPRHWNAWCGLGCVFFKNEKYWEAEIYYRKALKIAPTNPVLMCQLAVVQHARKKSDIAIETLTKALRIDPNNALCRFHRATIYSSLDRNKEALQELDELRQLVPEESMVYFLIGKIHKKMGNTDTALITFSWSTQLDPKGANNPIREVIDKQRSRDDDVVVHRDQSVHAETL